MLPVTAILSPDSTTRVEGGTRIENGENLRTARAMDGEMKNMIHGTEGQLWICFPQGIAKALSLFTTSDSTSRMKGHSLAVDGVAQRAFFPLGLS
ncbi:hypothetical protein ASPBRDRAFT_673575 [Aspergillus brasiliensis CBS 101740]|uniref:Uncharacterized protein n=1 Tax=Aspergillus brasiliensis (strain CBS 101740 / IMI 381727 / IBT 21946) TaxID=767769 RepID=A0A1L9UMZ7_ASPBC|nr:hypothetical protein ASPBRDRAFT_673575 [Aspergillus brasiliensis CBS 101740]